jgi:hypothetical protein
MKKDEINKIIEHYKDILPDEALDGITDINNRLKEIKDIQDSQKSKNLAQIKTNVKLFSLLSVYENKI